MRTHTHRVLKKARKVERAHQCRFSEIREMSLLVKMSLDVVEDLRQTRRGNAPTESIRTRLDHRILPGQEHGDGVAYLFSEQTSVGSAQLQFRVKNPEQILQAFVAERPAVHKIYHCSRKSSFRKLREMGRIQLEPQAIISTVPNRFGRAGATMHNHAACTGNHTLPP